MQKPEGLGSVILLYSPIELPDYVLNPVSPETKSETQSSAS